MKGTPTPIRYVSVWFRARRGLYRKWEEQQGQKRKSRYPRALLFGPFFPRIVDPSSQFHLRRSRPENIRLDDPDPIWNILHVEPTKLNERRWPPSYREYKTRNQPKNDDGQLFGTKLHDGGKWRCWGLTTLMNLEDMSVISVMTTTATRSRMVVDGRA